MYRSAVDPLRCRMDGGSNSTKFEVLQGNYLGRRSQWPRGLRRRSTAARLLRLWVRTPLGSWTFVCCECYVLSGRGFCDELITSPEESYRLWRVVVCDLETSKEEAKSPLKGCEYKPRMDCDAEKKKKFGTS